MGRGKSTKGDKNGKKIKKRSIGLINYEVHIPDVTTFKSVQVRLMGWIKPFIEADQRDYDRAMGSTKFRLKRMIREWSESYKFYRPESIVDVDTSDVSIYSKNRDCQYFKVDVVLYTREDLIFDKYFVLVTTEDLAERAMAIFEHYPEYWNFTINERYNKSKKVNV